MEEKTLKSLGKEAKRRLKSGFWESYRSEAELRKKKAETEGIAVSKVVEYNAFERRERMKNSVGEDGDENFYKKVKAILDESGETEDVIIRLVDKAEYLSLSYEQRQRYMLSLSEKYLVALERYKKERALSAIL
ncbi:MAG: hypothetical protein MJ072_02375 [Clostridia bacterium]|nr:hypothetical protein [Clostridia bacterium]